MMNALNIGEWGQRDDATSPEGRAGNRKEPDMNAEELKEMIEQSRKHKPTDDLSCEERMWWMRGFNSGWIARRPKPKGTGLLDGMAYDRGIEDWEDGFLRDKNPYKHPELRTAWFAGWDDKDAIEALHEGEG